MRKTTLFLVLSLLFVSLIRAQIPTATLIKIVKAEDARAYDKSIGDLLRSPSPKVRERATLAAGRIGSEMVIPSVIDLLTNDTSNDVRAMAAFALGETESIRGADAILRLVSIAFPTDRKQGEAVIARAVEAAGKIAAANAKDPKATELGKAIIAVLEAQSSRGKDQNREIVLLALTAALRARPEKADFTVAKFLTSADARIRSDAANTLTRLRSKNANAALRDILLNDTDDSARVNAARALGAAEDKDALNLLLEAATIDKNPGVRIAAIRSLASLKEAKVADRLLAHGEKLYADYVNTRKTNFLPVEQNEFIELAVTLGRLLSNTDNDRADRLFRSFGKLDKGFSYEVYIARTRIGQRRGDGKEKPELIDWRQYNTLAQIVGEFALIEPSSDTGKQMKAEAPGIIRPLAKAFAEADPEKEGKRMMAGPEVLQAFARFKTADLGEIVRTALLNNDVQLRATAAGILADLSSSKENVDAMKTAFTKALLTDKMENDAQLAILDALYKLDKKESVGTLLIALNTTDYLVRKKAFELLTDKDLQKDFPGITTSLENARAKHNDQVLPYSPVFGTKLGQVLNTDADYRRAVSRKNGSVKAVLTTEKGKFTIVFNPEEAPLTVDNFVKLARSGYFNGLEVHRVVPNFVMQDGDPRGDGNGGPGWSIRCEVNMLPYDRGAVGMALSGKDTGGSQWFVTHSPQPHLDGGYTVFGHVNQTDMKIVDSIVRGDKIINVKIVEAISTQRSQRPQRKK